MTTTFPPICLWCVHHHGKASINTCDAFPEGIPADVMGAAADHMENIPGDSGLKFELKPGAEFPKGLYPVADRFKPKAPPAAEDPRSRPPRPPSPAEGKPSGRIEFGKSTAAQRKAFLEEARREGREEPGRTTVLVPDPRATSPQAQADPPSPAEDKPSGRIVWRSLSDEEADALVAEAERRGKEEPGRITVAVPSKRV